MSLFGSNCCSSLPKYCFLKIFSHFFEVVTLFDLDRYEEDANKYWDAFYGQHQNKWVIFAR